jgi:hypothetical protein
MVRRSAAIEEVRGDKPKLRRHIDQSVCRSDRSRNKESIRMLGRLETSLEKRLPKSERRGPSEL